MGRVNKKTEGVFVDIVGSSKKISSYHEFINHGNSDGQSDTLKGFVSQYRTLVNRQKNTFEKLARMEEIIMQLRSMENISDIKLSLVREYVYARCPFYRNNSTAKDVRVIVDRLDNWDFTKKNPIDKLMSDKDFMTKCRIKLATAMDKEIKDNISNFNQIYK